MASHNGVIENAKFDLKRKELANTLEQLTTVKEQIEKLQESFTKLDK